MVPKETFVWGSKSCGLARRLGQTPQREAGRQGGRWLRWLLLTAASWQSLGGVRVLQPCPFLEEVILIVWWVQAASHPAPSCFLLDAMR